MSPSRWRLLIPALLLAGCGSRDEPKLEPVPETYRVLFETSKGQFVVEVNKGWAPEGAERFYRLVRSGFYDEARFFRVVRNFVVQFGINADPAVNRKWSSAFIKDDPVAQSNTRGSLTFATSGPNTRTTQVFINLADNPRLDKLGFAPFGRVTSGMDVVDKLTFVYGDGPPRGAGPDQNRIEQLGNAYLQREFPRLDYIARAKVE